MTDEEIGAIWRQECAKADHLTWAATSFARRIEAAVCERLSAIGGLRECTEVRLYDQAELDAAVAAERQRWQAYISKARAKSELVETSAGAKVLMPYWVMRDPV